MAIRKVLYLANFWIIIYVSLFWSSASCLLIELFTTYVKPLWITCFVNYLLYFCVISYNLCFLPCVQMWPAYQSSKRCTAAALTRLSAWWLDTLMECRFGAYQWVHFKWSLLPALHRLLPNMHTCWQCSRLKIECEKSSMAEFTVFIKE